MKRAFSDWTKWTDRAALADLGYPGVYALAISPAELSALPFSWRLEIVYVGMTNAKGGDGHGGGHRVRFKHSDYHELTSHLFVSVCPWECDVTLNDPANLRLMGEVTKHEYECFALFVEMFGNLPEFNDKKKSPKK